MLRERQLQHGWIVSVVQDMARDVPSIQSLPYLVCCLRVSILHQGLEASSLLKSCKLVNISKGAEDQVQHFNGDLDAGLQTATRMSVQGRLSANQLSLY